MTASGSQYLVIDAILPVLVARTLDRAVATTELVETALTRLGPIHRTESALRAGDRVLNDDRDVLPQLSRACGLGLCLYLGNRRVAASGALDGSAPPEIGGYADATLVDAVLRRAEVFRGEIEVQGRRLLCAARPLHPTSGDDRGALGIIEAYQDLDVYSETLTSALRSTQSGEAAGLENQADSMAQIVQFIDDVARRLQLLALNGNIIAAQAGEHGRAFRVVCRELSNLAEQSKDAASDARKLTKSLGLAEDDPEEHYDYGDDDFASEPLQADD